MRPLVLEWRLSVRAWTFFSQPAWKNGDTGRDDEANELPSSESATKRERERLQTHFPFDDKGT